MKMWLVGWLVLRSMHGMRNIVLRELKDELGVEGKILKEEQVIQVQQDEINARVFPFLASLHSSNVVLNEEHTKYAWVREEDVGNYDLAPGMDLII